MIQLNKEKNKVILSITTQLDIEDVKELWEKPCTYCGSPIDTIGIDRIDNSKGYLKGNITACCSLCNWMKRELSVDDFINHINKILYNYMKGGDAKWERPLSKKH